MSLLEVVQGRSALSPSQQRDGLRSEGIIVVIIVEKGLVEIALLSRRPVVLP